MSVTCWTPKLRRQLKAMRRPNLQALSKSQLKKRFEDSVRKGETVEQRRAVSQELRRRWRSS